MHGVCSTSMSFLCLCSFFRYVQFAVTNVGGKTLQSASSPLSAGVILAAEQHATLGELLVLVPENYGKTGKTIPRANLFHHFLS